MTNHPIVRIGPCIGCFNNKSNTNENPCNTCIRTNSKEATEDHYLTVTLNAMIREDTRQKL